MSDIVESTKFAAAVSIDAQPQLSKKLSEAAAEIERLRAECAELTRRMTPPPGCVRIGDKDLKVLGELPMTADGFVIASMFTDVWAIHERTGKPYKTSLYHRGFLSKLYSTEEAAKQAAEAARSSK